MLGQMAGYKQLYDWYKRQGEVEDTNDPTANAAMDDYRSATDEYLEGGPAEYDWLGDLELDELGELEQVKDTELSDIETDPEYDRYMMEALADLERQSDEGLTLRDEADMARIQGGVNRNLRGQRGAIEQNMARRGIKGSGLDLMAQQQAAQSSAEIEALRGLEKAAQGQERRQSASARLGQLGSQLQGQDFNQQAQIGQAQDSINRFNTQNLNQRQQYNNQMQNRQTQQNWQGQQNLANQNTRSAQDFQRNSMQAQQDLAKTNYNKAIDDRNRRQLAEQEAQRRQGAILGTVGAVGGGIAGGMAGGPMGAMAGAQAGRGLGQSISYSDERMKEGVSKEDDFDIEAFLRTIEPKKYSWKGDDKEQHGIVAQDLAGSKIGNEILREDENGMLGYDVEGAVGALLESVAHLNKKIDKGGGRA